jgi:hypothetical protein
MDQETPSAKGAKDSFNLDSSQNINRQPIFNPYISPTKKKPKGILKSSSSKMPKHARSHKNVLIKDNGSVFKPNQVLSLSEFEVECDTFVNRLTMCNPDNPYG